MKKPMQCLCWLFLVLAAAVAQGADHLLFTSFRGNGETGVYFAYSEDGYQWQPLKNNQPFVRPQHAGMLMRDPFLVKGPDQLWHLLWTTGWTRGNSGALTIGHATSADLLEWSAQQLIPIPLEGARNAWAPEMVWDERARQWIVFWSSTVPGRFPGTDETGDQGYNHRIWSLTTKDFQSFSQPALYFDCGFNCIDATLARDGARWVMVFKDERRQPVKKNLRLAFSNSPAGPWRDVSEPFTQDWVEGPSALQVGDHWMIYFDHYSKPHYYGARRTRDWKTFEDVSSKTSFPEDHRHGTAVRISPDEASRLRKE